MLSIVKEYLHQSNNICKWSKQPVFDYSLACIKI